VRALIISTHVPYFPATGASARDHYLVKYLVEEHQILFLAPIYNQKSAQLAKALPSWITFHPVYVPEKREPQPEQRNSRLSQLVTSRVERLKHIALEPPYEIMSLDATLMALEAALREIDWANIDIVQIEHSPIGRLQRAIPKHIPTVLDCHNVHSAIREREYRAISRRRRRVAEWTEWQKTRAYERATLRAFDWLLACSDVDKARLQALAKSENCTVVPNGVDTEYFRRCNCDNIEAESLVFVGAMSYEPNIEAVTYFCNQIFPIVLSDFPNARLTIVGHSPTPSVIQLVERFPANVFVTGTVDDVRPYLERSMIGIVPLLNGGGTRLKILEMLSMELPVVTTSIGSEGLEVSAGEHLLIADTAKSFAQAITTLMRDPHLAKRLGNQGREFVCDRYEWRRIAPTVNDVWRFLAANKR